MDDCNVFIGLDYHKDSVQVFVLTEDGRMLGNRRCHNDSGEVAAYAGRFGQVRGVAMESCEGSADFADALTADAGWWVHLAHPGYVSRMRQNPDKTDYSDARMLADLERVGYVPRVWLAPQAIRELRRLGRYRQQLVDERRSTKLRIGALLRQHRVRSGASRWSRPWRTWLNGVTLPEQSRWILDRHLARLDHLNQEVEVAGERLGQVTREDPVVTRLLSLPGVGEVTAWTLRAEVGRFDRFRSGKQLARFCGLTPHNASTGARQADAGLIHACNRSFRAVLIQAAHRLKRRDPRYVALARQLEARGKRGSVIAATVANRWVRWLYHEMKTMPAA